MSTADRWEQIETSSCGEIQRIRHHNGSSGCNLVTLGPEPVHQKVQCAHDLSGKLCSISEAGAHLLGYEVEELLQLPVHSWILPEFRSQFDAYLETLKASNTSTGRFCVRHRNGERRTWLYNSHVVRDGVAYPIVNVEVQDVTDRRCAEQALRASEQRYRNLFEKSVAGVLLTTLSGKVVDCNEAWARMFGFHDASEALGLDITKCYPRDLNRDEIVAELKSTGSLQPQEFRLPRVDGTEVWVLLNCRLVSSCNGESLIQSTLIDISKRKRAETALLAREEDYRRFVSQSSEGIFRQDLDAPIPIDLPEDELIRRIIHDSYMAECSDSLARMYGFQSATEMVGKRLTEMLDANDPRNLELTREFVRSGFRITDRESHETDMHGNPRVFRNSMTGVVENGTLVRTWGIQTDITEQVAAEKARSQAEASLRKSEEHFRLLVEQASDGIFVSDSEGHYVDVNSAATEMLGYSREELLRMSIADIIASHEVERIPIEVARFADGKVVHSEWLFKRKDGTFFPGEVVGRSLPDGRLQAILRDISERKQAEEVLRESAARERTRAHQLQTLLDTLPIPVLISYDRDCREIKTNRSGWEYFGIAPGSNVSLSAPPDERPKFRCLQDGLEIPADQLPMQRAAAKGERVRGFETRMVLPDGTERYELGNAAPLFDDEGNICGAVAAAIDMSEQFRAKEALRRNEERFRVALNNSPITVFNQDLDLRYTWIYNPNLYWGQDAIGKTDAEILGAKKAAQLEELKRKVLSTGKPVREEIVIGQNGNKYAFDVTLEPLLGPDGAIVGITGASMDIAKLHDLADSLRDAKDKLAREKSYLEQQIETELGFEDIIGQSLALRDSLKKAKVVAPTDSTVLLLGETGTGKELVARSVHQLSERRDRNFIKLNCAAVPSGLLESELFGHEKGAFTGAVSQKVGRIELADQGTLFLDEIGELPLELQPKLLRVLQDREFERLGGIKTVRVNVRIVAATNRDLRQDVAEKKFREDLFYRLNVFPIELPPLRNRRADIPMLVQHFVTKHSIRMRKHIDTIPDESMAVLQRWNWPGNVRELENLIERMVILTRGNILAPPPTELYADSQQLNQDSLNEIEREHIIRVLRETNGVLSGNEGAAMRLGIKRTTLQSMLKRFGIQPGEFRRGAAAGWKH